MNHNDTSVSAVIFGQSVTLQGGFTNCSAFGSTGRTTIDGSGGSLGSVFLIFGGTANVQYDVHLRDLTIRGGEDDGFGGGIDILGGMNVVLERTIVEENASAFGGGISIRGVGEASLQIADFSQVLANQAAQDGGGVYCEAATVALLSSVIASNEATNGGGVAANGCFLQNESGGILGINLNTAQDRGGGIFAEGGSTVELTGNSVAPASIFLNTASSGGGVWVGESEVRARNASIATNSAVNGGGGVRVHAGGRFFMERLPGGKCHIVDRCSTLSDNSASSGGGFWVSSLDEPGIVDIRQTYIEGNVATEEGNAGIVVGPTASVAMEGVVLTGNHGGTSVVKIDSDGSGVLAFVTMTDNSASDAVILVLDDTYGHAASLGIYSSILWEPAAAGVLLGFDPSTPVTVDCLMVNDNRGLPPGAFITVLPPIFVDAAGGDYHLHSNSPAIDYCDGTAYAPTHRDIDHQERGKDDPEVFDRFLASWFDIGADALALPGLIFSDGFESGEITEWSATSP